MFSGSFTALVTPFSADGKEVDFQSLDRLMEWQLEQGTSGFVVCGTTAEAATLSADERIAVVNRVLEKYKGKVPVIVGTGTNSTATTIELTHAAKEMGADAALICSPYYNKPTQEGLCQHFKAVTKAVDIPIVVYNIPGRTSVDIATATFERLCQLSQIVAVKEASGSSAKLLELAERVGGRLALLSGEDHMTFNFMACGGKGVITASGNVIPKEMSAIVKRFLAGDVEGSREMQFQMLPLIRALFIETNPTPAKTALALMGKISHPTVRLPLVGLTAESKKVLEQALKSCGALS